MARQAVSVTMLRILADRLEENDQLIKSFSYVTDNDDEHQVSTISIEIELDYVVVEQEQIMTKEQYEEWVKWLK